jgi:hypothetical protein
MPSEKNEKNSHYEVDDYQSNGCPVPGNDPGTVIENAFPVSSNRSLFHISGDIGCEIANRTVSRRNIGSRSLAADCL